MPANRIKVDYESGQPIAVRVWNDQGKEYDASQIFQQISGAVSAGKVWTELMLRHGQNTLTATLRFEASKKELNFDVDASVIKQIIEMGATEQP